jgi:hypothetical protein
MLDFGFGNSLHFRLPVFRASGLSVFRTFGLSDIPTKQLTSNLQSLITLFKLHRINPKSH